MQRGTKQIIFILLVVFILAFQSCIEEFDPKDINSKISNELETALVVDARITDEQKRQSVFLSRVFSFESDGPSWEQNAIVTLTDDSGSVFSFSEDEPGNYISEDILTLEADQEYILEIRTQDGKVYVSEREKIPSKVPIESIQGKRKESESGNEGIGILISNSIEQDTPTFFRYEYSETYKIVAPDFEPFEWDEVDYDFFMNDDDGWEVTIKPREEDVRVCYGNNLSEDLILTSTANLTSGDIENFEIRFLGRNNPFIAHRYSILVKQYHHSMEANSFFNALEDFTSFESFFSAKQPGFLQGNIRALDSDDKVLGYFELSSYTEKRYFFNFEDFFPDESLPPFFINCSFIGKPALYPEGFHSTEIDGEIVLDGVSNSPLIDGILADSFAFVGENEDYPINELGELDRAPYLVKPVGCVDCRTWGENVVPEFWIEK